MSDQPGAEMAMNTRTTIAIAAVVVALASSPTSAHAQLVGATVVNVPTYAGYATQVVLPGCQVVRQQFEDVYGWRVRDALVCSPRQSPFGQ
jgi:methionine-rich copper-binding protein CopC